VTIKPKISKRRTYFPIIFKLGNNLVIVLWLQLEVELELEIE